MRDVLPSTLYGVEILPLIRKLKELHIHCVQPWYADDMAMHGHVNDITDIMHLLLKEGPQRGYFPEPAKSICICDLQTQNRVRPFLEEFKFQYKEGYRYLGKYIGTTETLQQWLQPKVAEWAEGVQELAHVARRFPQTAYAGLAKSLQSEWQFLQRVCPGIGETFAPVEHAIASSYIPSLLGDAEGALGPPRELTSLSVKTAGLGLPCPVTLALHCHESSVEATCLLTTSLLYGGEFSYDAHSSHARKAKNLSKLKRVSEQVAVLEGIQSISTKRKKRRLEQVQETGAWM